MQHFKWFNGQQEETSCRNGMPGDTKPPYLWFWRARLITDLLLLSLTLLILLLVGCGTKGDVGNTGLAGQVDLRNEGTAQFAVIETVPDSTLVVSDTGEVTANTVIIRGTGEIDLELYGFRLEGNNAYELVEVRGCRASGCETTLEGRSTPLEKLEAPLVVGTDGIPYSYVEVQVDYDPGADRTEEGATLIISNNADGSAEKRLTLSTSQGQALIAVFPPEVDFGSIQSGETPSKDITIENLGAEPLLITSMNFQGPSSFSLEMGGEKYPVGTYELAPAFTIEPFGTRTIVATFAPQNGDPATASVKLISNATNTEVGGEEVILRGNNSGPRLTVNPELVNFGPKPVGQWSVLPVQIASTGTSPLVITDIGFKEGANPAFQLDLSSLPGLEEGTLPSAENPLIVNINQVVEFQVRFIPETESAKTEANQMIPETGTLVIENNTYEPIKEVEVKGIGASGDCPVAVIVIQEGEQVIPQTKLHLFGDQSSSPLGAINKWEWSVQQPVGSQSVFLPSANFPKPTFEANVAGKYVFKLSVWDTSNTPSCVPDEATVVVIPDEAIHVELLWDTPNDSDQSNEGSQAGADLDLHFVHQYAGGPDLDGNGVADGWFDDPFDCFWHNPKPKWGSFDPAVNDDPGLDRDDTDGAGPENMNLDIPENNVTYKVGVHYWEDHGFGASYATVRIYLYADLVYEMQDVKLLNRDMWEVATIDWPSGNVQGIEDGFKVIPDYNNPFFPNP